MLVECINLALQLQNGHPLEGKSENQKMQASPEWTSVTKKQGSNSVKTQ
jgi:hypothetical protein